MSERHSRGRRDDGRTKANWAPVSRGVRRRAAEDASPTDHGGIDIDQAAAPASLPVEPAQVGEHVAMVLAAADAAARKLRAEAERDASRTRERATVATKEIKSDAERYVAARRREAEAEAGKLVRGAEAEAAALTRAAGERARLLSEQIAASEERLRELATGLRAATAALDNLLTDSRDHEPEQDHDAPLHASRRTRSEQPSATAAP
jgi:hypothetical protein